MITVEKVKRSSKHKASMKTSNFDSSKSPATATPATKPEEKKFYQKPKFWIAVGLVGAGVFAWWKFKNKSTNDGALPIEY